MPKDPRDSRAWRAVSKKVLQRDGYVCVYCGQDATTADHIISIKHSPELCFNLDNLVASCRPCNSKKGSRSESVFLARTFTPPVFPAFLSPKTDITTQNGPCAGQPEQNN